MVSRALTTVQNGMTIDQAAIMAPIQEMQLHRRILAAFIKSEMQSGKDFGVIPGTDKPTLLKPGAEKLCRLFRYAPQLTLVSSVEDWDRRLFHYHYKCTIYDMTQKCAIAEADGAANSLEKKFQRSTTVFANQATEEEKAIGRLEERTSKAGKTYQVYVINDPDAPFNNVHNVLSMAQKRAFVKAVAIACNASDYFAHPDEEIEESSLTPQQRSEIIAKTGEEMIRTGFDENKAKTYLRSNYEKSTRKALSDSELLEFLEFLQKLPNAVEAQTA